MPKAGDLFRVLGGERGVLAVQASAPPFLTITNSLTGKILKSTDFGFMNSLDGRAVVRDGQMPTPHALLSRMGQLLLVLSYSGGIEAPIMGAFGMALVTATPQTTSNTIGKTRASWTSLVTQ